MQVVSQWSNHDHMVESRPACLSANPAESGDGRLARYPQCPSRMADVKTQRIVLVDDEPDIVWSLIGGLSRELPSVKVEGLTDPESALRLIEKTPIDLLITDIHMPRISGMELLI